MLRLYLGATHIEFYINSNSPVDNADARGSAYAEDHERIVSVSNPDIFCEVGVYHAEDAAVMDNVWRTIMACHR